MEQQVLLAFMSAGPPWIRTSRVREKPLADLADRGMVLIYILF